MSAPLHDDTLWQGEAKPARLTRAEQRIRRRARVRALQALYAADQLDLTLLRRTATMVFDDLAIEPEVRERASRLIATVADRHADLDAALMAVTENWRLERLGAIERCILRLAAAELQRAETPPRTVIQEFVLLAERFGSPRAAGFVNGVLDAYARRSGKL
ncbi:MAG: transcription antitermination factor NusB [Gemmatimonadetes bacterium]|nr:transcription antitermination factor NusB [Gemmatimonadota bacterium]